MQYRSFGKLAWHPSSLGFGCMRLPTIAENPAKIDKPQATEMIRYAIDHGVNYLDTAWPYHRQASEPFVGEVLQDGYREKVKLATKLPSWLIKEPDDFDRYLDRQLKRLQTDHIDFYLLHALQEEWWHKLRDMNIFAPAERALADGRIRHLGFSFHDEFKIFQEIVDGYANWDFCQIQYNYMDVNYQAGRRGLHYAAERGLAVVIMEGLRGGSLAQNPPPEPVAELWAKSERDWKPAEWGLQWLWNQPEVALVLSGMSTLQHVEENVTSAGRSSIGALTEKELARVKRVRQAFEQLAPIPCTNCQYCLPCPHGVNIPRVFAIYNEAQMYQDLAGARSAYQWLDKKQRAHNCVECGECEPKCPQQIQIIEWLKKADTLLTAEGQ
ncbi:MAG: aldo/keto reductase [Chloroflexota bacterium]|nr:aldo/keto reductase [Chloroflexota bacterium]